MADSASPPPSEEPKAPQRETLRISLPPRPLKPASTKITPRPNVSAATTLPIMGVGGIETTPMPTVPPAWSTAVTKPIPSLSRPPSGAIPQLPPKAPPLTGAPPGSKTTPLFPPRPPTQPVAGVASPELGKPATKVIPNPGVEPTTTPSGHVGTPTLPPRVIVANPQAKVFLQSSQTEKTQRFDPIPHQSKPPNLTPTTRVSIVAKSDPAVVVIPTEGSAQSTVEAKAPPPVIPQSLAPQPPLSTPPEVQSGVTVAPGRPQLPGGGIAPVQLKRPTSSLRLVDLPANPASQAVTQPLSVMPTVAPPVPLTVAQSGPVVKPSVPVALPKEDSMAKFPSGPAPIAPPPLSIGASGSRKSDEKDNGKPSCRRCNAAVCGTAAATPEEKDDRWNPHGDRANAAGHPFDDCNDARSFGTNSRDNGVGGASIGAGKQTRWTSASRKSGSRGSSSASGRSEEDIRSSASASAHKTHGCHAGVATASCDGDAGRAGHSGNSRGPPFGRSSSRDRCPEASSGRGHASSARITVSDSRA